MFKSLFGFMPYTLLLLLGCFLSSPLVYAHKLKVFAFVEGNQIEGGAYFVRGGKAYNATIIIKDAEQQILAELQQSPEGTFTYQAQAPIDHFIVADSGDGHQAEWLVSAAELLPGFNIQTHTNSPAAPDTVNTLALPPASTNTTTPTPLPILNTELEAAIERAVARQVRPLREELLLAQEAFRIRDILGGLGYIFGLMGLALWWQSRHTQPPNAE